MDQVKLRRFEQKLRGWRGTLEEQLRPTQRIPDETDPLSRQQDEMAGSLEQLWRRAVVIEIRDIDLAIEKIREGTFGICERCDEPISEKRLEVVPWARRCFECQSTMADRRTRLVDYRALSRWYSPS